MRATRSSGCSARPPTGHDERDGKTFAGSLACWLASLAGIWLLAGYAPLVAVPIAVAAALAESMPVRIDDNIRVAVAAGAIAQILA